MGEPATRPGEATERAKEAAISTHYDVLGVATSADHDEIRRAYHQAARRWHPDQRSSMTVEEASRADAEMRRVNEAWQVLRRADSRREYDRRLADGGSASRANGIRVDDQGVSRIDPRLLDPSFLAARRHAQLDEISNRSSIILRSVPIVALLALLVAIFVGTAYARSGGDVASTTTMAGPSLGAGIVANDCVSVLSGPSLIERPCGPGADGRVIGAHLPGGVCPTGTTREVELSNETVACLGPA
ncbi:MAG: J domain-containing protein [Acidimicrobiales bacterium]